jgi:predicted transcriptional regulator
MSFTKEKRDKIQHNLMELINNDDAEFIQKLIKKYSLTATSIRRYIKELIDQNIIRKDDERACGYDLTWTEYEYIYDIANENFEEHEIYGEILAPVIKDFSESAKKIWPYVFVEIMNNALEHSGADKVICKIRTSYLYTDIIIADTGEGIFQRIKDYVKKEKNIDISTRDIILELHKGKLTIAKYLHTGEGIFFVSKMLDYFAICSDNQVFYHGMQSADASLKAYLESYANKISGYGTTVWMCLSNFSTRKMNEIFDEFSSDNEGFSKTIIPIREICHGGYPVARSLARRLVYRMEQFGDIILDFSEVPMIGQGFAHEVFVVFKNKFPEVNITAINANSDVNKMIQHVLNTKYDD